MSRKKLLIGSMIATVIMGQALTAYAEPLAHLDGETGTVDVVGYELNPEENVIFVLLEYQNNSSESNSPCFEFSINAFQDGVELESSYSSNTPDDYHDSLTKVQPGSTLKYYDTFEYSGSSPIDVEVSPIFNFDSEYAKCTFNLSETGTSEDETEQDYKTMYEELKTQYDELLKKYEELSAE